MKKAEKKLIRQMTKLLNTAPDHYLLYTGNQGEGFTITGAVEPDTMSAVAMAAFASLDNISRRAVHTLMANQMEEAPEDVYALIRSDWYGEED